MDILEKELETYIYNKGEININGTNVKIINRQFKVSNYYIDLLGQDEEKNIYVFELKKGIIDGNALSQLLCYMDCVATISNQTLIVHGVLIGNGISDYMELAVNQLENVTYKKYDLDLIFKEQYWDLSNSFLESDEGKKQTKILESLSPITKKEGSNEPSKMDKDND